MVLVATVLDSRDLDAGNSAVSEQVKVPVLTELTFI